jgi:hypothetical protein
MAGKVVGALTFTSAYALAAPLSDTTPAAAARPYGNESRHHRPGATYDQAARRADASSGPLTILHAGPRWPPVDRIAQPRGHLRVRVYASGSGCLVLS